MGATELTSSLKNYLQVIYSIYITKGIVHLTDIAVTLKVKKPSVSRAVSQLEELGFLSHEYQQPLYLTEAGKQLGRDLTEKIDVIRCLLVKVLKVEEDVADKESRRMAYMLSDTTIERLDTLVGINMKCPLLLF